MKTKKTTFFLNTDLFAERGAFNVDLMPFRVGHFKQNTLQKDRLKY